MRELLLQQLEIPWSLATRYYLPGITGEEVLHWEPSSNIVRLRQRDGDFYADWPDEESQPMPNATIGWLFWHIEWWWGDAIGGVHGDQARQPTRVAWSGSLEASRRRLAELHDKWQRILTTTDLETTCVGPWPTAQPLSTIALWVNVELMKNVAEIGQLLRLRGNQV